MDFMFEEWPENAFDDRLDCSENDSNELLMAALLAGRAFTLDDYLVISQQPEILSAPIGDLLYGVN